MTAFLKFTDHEADIIYVRCDSIIGFRESFDKSYVSDIEQEGTIIMTPTQNYLVLIPLYEFMQKIDSMIVHLPLTHRLRSNTMSRFRQLFSINRR